MSNITDFSRLKSKYNGFIKPNVDLSVISKSNRNKFVVSDITIELSCEFSANIANINIYNVYDDENKKFKDNDIDQVFQIGKKININIGYDKSMECVFCGFISGISYNFSDRDLPYISLECLDVRAIMMASNQHSQLLQENYSACINDIINKSEYKSYFKTTNIDSNIKSPSGDDKLLFELTDESDYDFIVKVAKKFGYEFFVSQETIYFRKKRIKKEPILTLSNKNLITNLEATFNIAGIANSVEIRNIDDKTGKIIQASSRSSAVFAKTSSASKITSKAIKVIIDPSISSEDEAQTRADVELDRLSWNFGTFFIKTIGLPELIPGRFIKIDGISDNVNKKVYIVKVIHEINESGFKTSMEAKLDSL